MVIEKKGDMFAEQFNVMCNPTNCKGVMGAGLAKRFAQFYPAMAEWYHGICQHSDVQPGDVDVWRVDAKLCVYNVATKNHWRDSSQYAWVKVGLLNIRERLLKQAAPGYRMQVAIPALGCGLGGLDYAIVAKMTHDNFDDVDHDVTLFQS